MEAPKPDGGREDVGLSSSSIGELFGDRRFSDAVLKFVGGRACGGGRGRSPRAPGTVCWSLFTVLFSVFAFSFTFLVSFPFCLVCLSLFIRSRGCIIMLWVDDGNKGFFGCAAISGSNMVR